MKYKIIKAKERDKVQTPSKLGKRIIDHFKPTGKLLEPCCGDGTGFLQFMKDADWCEIDKNKDFFEYHTKVDWLITNPPFSIMRQFLEHSLELADNIVFFVQVKHLFTTKARLNLIKNANFGFKEIIMIDLLLGKEYEFGFQLAVIHLKKNYKGQTKISWWNEKI